MQGVVAGSSAREKQQQQRISSDILQQEMDHRDDCKFMYIIIKADKFVVVILELSCVAVLYLGLVPSRL